MSDCLVLNPNLVHEATAALRAFHVEDRRTAQLLLDMWSKRIDLSDAEASEILTHYPDIEQESGKHEHIPVGAGPQPTQAATRIL